MHQADPVRTLGRIAGLVRPGGWIVAHEPAEMIDNVVAILRAAKAGGYEWVTSPFLLNLVLRKPQAM